MQSQCVSVAVWVACVRKRERESLVSESSSKGLVEFQGIYFKRLLFCCLVGFSVILTIYIINHSWHFLFNLIFRQPTAKSDDVAESGTLVVANSVFGPLDEGNHGTPHAMIQCILVKYNNLYFHSSQVQ